MKRIGFFFVLMALAAQCQAQKLATDGFRGKYRTAARTEFLQKRSDEYKTVAALRAALPLDAKMRKAYKTLAARVPEEQHRVEVPGNLYAIAWDRAEGDLRLIVGDAPQAGKLIQATIVGIPPGIGPQGMVQFGGLRKDILKIIGPANEKKLAASQGFIKLAPPVRVRVVGGRFFQGAKPTPPNPPAGLTPSTAWTIGPVQAIDQPR